MALVTAFLRVGGWQPIARSSGVTSNTDTISYASSLPNMQLPTDKEMSSLVAIQGPSHSLNISVPTASLDSASVGQASKDNKVSYEVRTYEVAQDDTLWAIAERFNVSAETVMWANNIKNGDTISIGQKLDIPPVSGTLHTVQDGETAIDIATRYAIDVEALVAFEGNKIADPDRLGVGQRLVVPGGVRPQEQPKLMVASASSSPPSAPAPVPAPSLAPPPPPPPPPAPIPAPVETRRSGIALQWPTYGPTSTYPGHKGTDIGSPIGAPVYAAEAGVVTLAGELYDGYGIHIIIDHGNGFTTLYAHLSQALVRPGQAVGRGANIGKVGMTGRTNGPHLHFEVRYGGVPRNPLDYLP